MILSMQKHMLTHPVWLCKQRYGSCCVWLQGQLFLGVVQQAVLCSAGVHHVEGPVGVPRKAAGRCEESGPGCVCPGSGDLGAAQ